MREGSPEEVLRALTLETERIYLSTCQDFGISGCGELHIKLLERFENFASGRCINKMEGGIISTTINYSMAYCRLMPERIFRDTIPHEVAHAIICLIYPEKFGSLLHGKEWQELAQYLGAQPQEYFDLDFSQAFELENFSEPNLPKV